MAAEEPKIWLAPPVKAEEVGTAAPVPVGATPVAMAVVVPLETWEEKNQHLYLKTQPVSSASSTQAQRPGECELGEIRKRELCVYCFTHWVDWS